MNTTLFAVRHGETHWNIEGKLQGHLDSSLTELGVLQAKAMAEGLKNFRIDRMIASDLGRTVQTAEIISTALDLEFTTDIRLRERNFGDLNGCTREEIRMQFPDVWNAMNRREPEFCPPSGESLHNMFFRSVSAAEEIAFSHPGKRILLVTHGGVLTSFMRKALNLPLSQRRTFSLLNGSLNSFSISHERTWQLLSWGEISHLRAHTLESQDDW